MKTKTFTEKHAFRTLGLFGLLMLLTLAFNPVFGQSTERAVKGIINDEGGPLAGATVYLKGTDFYTTTNENGQFTFPKLLKESDILVIHHLGYSDQKITIGPDTTFINLDLTDYEIVIIGALRIGSNTSPQNKNN